MLAKPCLHTDFTAKQDWFDLFMMSQIGELEFPFAALRIHLFREERIYKLKNRHRILIPEIHDSFEIGITVVNSKTHHKPKILFKA